MWMVFIFLKHWHSCSSTDICPVDIYRQKKSNIFKLKRIVGRPFYFFSQTENVHNPANKGSGHVALFVAKLPLLTWKAGGSVRRPPCGAPPRGGAGRRHSAPKSPTSSWLAWKVRTTTLKRQLEYFCLKSPEQIYSSPRVHRGKLHLHRPERLNRRIEREEEGRSIRQRALNVGGVTNIQGDNKVNTWWWDGRPKWNFHRSQQVQTSTVLTNITVFYNHSEEKQQILTREKLKPSNVSVSPLVD